MNVDETRGESRGSVGRRGVIALLLVLTACSSEHETPGSRKPEPSGGSLGFEQCPSDLPGAAHGRSCASVAVPLLWDEPDGQSIDISLVRYPSQSPHHGQLWLLDGGPGGTGAVFMQEDILRLYTGLGLDVYVPQHRGTGHSTPLYCAKRDDLSACGGELLATWGDGLRGFHSLEAGRDIGFLIDRTRAADEPVFVLGLSYGSYWAQRYLQAYPAQASGVILEGAFPLGAALWESDPLADAAGRSLFQACRDDSDCAAAFGDEEPEDAARGVLAVADDPARRCLGEDGADRSFSELVLSLFVVSDLAQAVPGLVRRLERCSARDQAELTALGSLLSYDLGVPVDQNIDNEVLGEHVMRTDIMARLSTFPLERLLDARAPLVIWSGAGTVEEYAAMVDGWPVNYPPGPADQGSLETPVLLMNGGLDIQTPSPWARDLAQKLGGTLVEFPFVGHGVDISLASPFTVNDASCSLGILAAFLAHPAAAVDGSCAATAYTPDVAGRAASSQALAAVLYGGETPLLGAADDAPSAKRVESAARERELFALRQAVRTRLKRALRELGMTTMPLRR